MWESARAPTFEFDLETNLLALQRELLEGAYHLRPLRLPLGPGAPVRRHLLSEDASQGFLEWLPCRGDVAPQGVVDRRLVAGSTGLVGLAADPALLEDGEIELTQRAIAGARRP